MPAGWRRWLRRFQRRHRLQATPAGTIDWGGLRRRSPISSVFGLDRGIPIDRYYIERFLSEHASDIQGHVLEFGDDRYIRQFGGRRVVRADIMGLVSGSASQTLRADLTDRRQLPPNRFDCIICTQTLQMIFDIHAALANLEWMLRPGGVLLATAHGISRIARREGVDDWGEYWHVTSQAARRLFTARFDPETVTVKTYGNVLAAVASLHGVAAEELTADELDATDRDYELVVAIRAVKPREER
jgi:SAM-dependent methyltransferase